MKKKKKNKFETEKTDTRVLRFIFIGAENRINHGRLIRKVRTASPLTLRPNRLAGRGRSHRTRYNNILVPILFFIMCTSCVFIYGAAVQRPLGRNSLDGS